ncbi:TIGR04283 family arsenosugar biosynthesis glycosyltransferase [uncultured Maribacter sp.]|uniref:TIGR04283 family arsenosugar biosynthesis glycosyltransferase n=1 Tax=uncultured Maribacter sp. TaxID=431308 RepID=UPI002609642B|nr:TIGR04283 family arsenosugar biosynthesis glycosyltransferase [uncultured Maribacter sp.]
MKNNPPQISIIIPVLNEEKSIPKLLSHLKTNISKSNYIQEIIIVDGGSTDNSVTIAKESGATVVSSKKGRAIQMNVGAKKAKGSILYFLHIDTFPPKKFDALIVNAFLKKQPVGCFQMKFDNNHLFLKFFAWFSKINHKICRGGDQSLFISKKLFNSLNGFNENFIIYEDNEFISRIYKGKKFTILPQKVTTSARKYEEIGIYKLQYYFGIIHLKKHFGASPLELHNYYKKKVTIH